MGAKTLNGEQRQGGTIFRRDGGRQTFFEQALLKPYLDAYKARKAVLMATPH
jgi:hypothetical protein